MKRTTLLIAFLLAVIATGYGQVVGYTRTVLSGQTYTQIPGGTVINTNAGLTTGMDTNQDDGAVLVTLPFTFTYDGNSFTQATFCTNGWVGMGNQMAVSAANSRILANLFSTVAPNNTLAAWFADGGANFPTGNGSMVHGTIGTDVYAFEWRNSVGNGFTQNTLNTINYMVVIYGPASSNPGRIEFLYGSTVGTVSTARAIGIENGIGGAGNFQNALNGSSTSTDTATAWPGNGNGYRFDVPPACSGLPVAGTLTTPANQFLCSGTVPATITITGATNNVGAISYQWEQSTDGGTTWTNAIGGSGNTTTVYTPPAFSGTAIQYRLKVTCTATGDAAFSPVTMVNLQAAPALQASALTTTLTSPTNMNLSWTIGDGQRRVVILSTSPITDPASASGIPAFTGAAAFTNSGQQIVYDGTATTVNVTGLTCNTMYYIKVYEYKRCGSGPYDVYINTTTGTNAATVTTGPATAAAFPVVNNFTGFTGANLSAAVPGWYEALIATPALAVPAQVNPTGNSSAWTSSTVFTQTTAKLNLFAAAKNEWIISPKIAITSASRLKLKAAITNFNTIAADADRMQGTDDAVNVLVSTDGCGAVWTSIYTFNAASTVNLTNALTDFILPLTAYTGQTIQIAFQATEGPLNDAPDYDFHIGDIIVEAIPACDAPLALTAVANAGSLNSGTVNFTAPAVAPANGYEYYVSTTNTAPVVATTATGTLAAGTTTVALPGLTTDTTYYVWVRSVCSSSDKSAWTGPASFTPGYCTPAPTSVDGTGITNVVLGTISNATISETGNYGNYSSLSTTAAAGSTVNFAITYTTGYTYGTKIWIDFNNDADFTDAGELVYTGLSLATNPTTLAGSFTIPANAALVGSHRVRIGGTDENTGPDSPCYSGIFGSFEDYTLNVIMPAAPVVASFSPDSYCTATGVITVTGTNLSSAQLSIGGTPITTTTNTDTQIVATVAAGVSGTVTVTTLGGTVTTPGTFSVVAPTALVLSTNAVSVCNGQSATVTVTSGGAAYDTYVWVPAAGVTGNAASGFVFNPAATTTYTVTASNATTGCTTTATVVVTVNAVPAAITIAPAVNACADTVLPLTATGGQINGIATIGTATTLTGITEQPTAFNNRWASYTSQIIYTAAELNAAGIGAGNIGSIAYEITTLGDAATNDNFTVKIGSTTATVFANTTFASTTGTTTVYGPATYTHTAPGWNTVTFTTPYVWDGTSNILVTVTHNGANDIENAQTYYTETPGNTVLWANSLTALTGTLSPKRLNTRFTSSAATTIVWTPSANLFTDAAATLPYTGGNAATVYFKSAVAGTNAYTVSSNSAAGCSVSAPVTVTIISTPAPVATASQVFCNAATVANLTATPAGTATINWYAAATGGTTLTATTALTNGTVYYASQTANGCESLTRTAVTAVVNVIAAPVATATQTFCNAGTVAGLTATGVAGSTITWYTAATGGTVVIADTALTNGTIYYASQTVDGCESLTRTAVTAVVNVIAAPVADATQTFCNTGTVAGLTATGVAGSTITWYTAATGGTALSADTALANGSIYYASQTVDGCESLTRTAVTVVVNVIAAPVADATQTFCNTGTVAGLSATGVAGSTITWYTAATGGTVVTTDTALDNGTVYYVSQTVNGCESIGRTAVTAVVNIIAAPVADASQTFCTEGTVAQITATGVAGSTITWYATATGGAALEGSTALVNGLVYYASQTVNGCESIERTAVTVNITTIVVEDPADVTVCDSYTLPALNIGGYFTLPNGTGTMLPAGTVITTTQVIYIFAQVGNCSDETSFTITVNSAPAITGEATQTVTAGIASEATIEDLVIIATGTVVWYASEADALAETAPLDEGTLLVNGNTYYAVQTVGTCNSAPFAVTVTVTLGTKDFDTRAFSYYPNPVEDVLNISYSSDITSVAVFNLLGQQVIIKQINAAIGTIDMSNLAEGAYMVNVTAGNQVKTIKVIKKQ